MCIISPITIATLQMKPGTFTDRVRIVRRKGTVFPGVSLFTGGRGYPKVPNPPPSQVPMGGLPPPPPPAKVPTPRPGPDGGRGYSNVPTPHQPRYLNPLPRSQWGVPQGTNPPPDRTADVRGLLVAVGRCNTQVRLSLIYVPGQPLRPPVPGIL